MEEKVGIIRRETHIRDDDGTELTDIEDIKDGRGILNWLRDHH